MKRRERQVIRTDQLYQDKEGNFLPDELQPIAKKNQAYIQHKSTRYIHVTTSANGLQLYLHNGALVEGKKSLPELYSNKEECCGCSSCYAVCPMSGDKRVRIARRGTDGNLGSDGINEIASLTSGYSQVKDIRPHTGAITMLPDEEGFLYPVVDAEICVRCYLCMKVCAFHETQENNNGGE